ncbi:MAG: hypothetical protein MUC96_29835, partial [Myxococcaceae bacterium]|nr:hypothetical protein [Myxococcaceae bacterium]
EAMAVSASFEYRLSDRWTLAAAAGAIVAGRLVADAETFDFRGGAVGSVSGSFLALEQGRFWPFIMVAASLAVSGVQAVPTAYWAVDGRLTATVGYTFFDRVTPYAVGRVFGGPVFWRGRTGTDLFHYQVGAGLVVGLPLGFDLSAEVVPLGEQRVTAGVGFSF